METITVHDLQTLQLTKVKTVKVLSELTLKHRVAFLASCCERLVPNYRAFSIVHQYGGNDLVNEVLDGVWNFLIGSDLSWDEEHIRKMSQSLESIAPSLEDFRSIYVVPALYAIDALKNTVQCCLVGDIEYASNVIDIMVAAMDDYLYSVTFPYFTMPSPEATKGFYRWAWESPLIVTELEKQQQDLTMLESQTLLSHSFIKMLRESAKGIGIHFVERGFVLSPPKPLSQAHPNLLLSELD